MATRATSEIYLDHSASTPVDPRVLDAMLPYFSEGYGNPSSAHGPGRAAERAIEEARECVAALLNCAPSEIIFTGGGSESDNLAIRGAAWLARQKRASQRLITSPVEHEAVTITMRQLSEMQAFEMAIAPVDSDGLVDAEAFGEICRAGGAIASIIYANNEVGSVNDLPALAEIARSQGILFHTDAVQAGGQLCLDVERLGVDMLSLSAHKFYGPKGVGLLYLRQGIDLPSAITGGGHEHGRRAGTQNTPGIVGLAKALQLAHEERAERLAHFQARRDQLIEGVLRRVPNARLSGCKTRRLPSHASFVLPGIDANLLLMHLDMRGIAASSGSACKTGNPEPSQVLLAMGYAVDDAKCGLRLSVGMQTSEADIATTVDVLADAVAKLSRLRREPAA